MKNPSTITNLSVWIENYDERLDLHSLHQWYKEGHSKSVTVRLMRWGPDIVFTVANDEVYLITETEFYSIKKETSEFIRQLLTKKVLPIEVLLECIRDEIREIEIKEIVKRHYGAVSQFDEKRYAKIINRWFTTFAVVLTAVFFAAVECDFDYSQVKLSALVLYLLGNTLLLFFAEPLLIFFIELFGFIISGIRKSKRFIIEYYSGID